jgi:hypothetical protein
MIQEYENLLRSIISNTLGIVDETDFKVSPERIVKWKDKREEELKKFDGILSEKRLIYYSDFYDLGNIISKNWDKEPSRSLYSIECFNFYRRSFRLS